MKVNKNRNHGIKLFLFMLSIMLCSNIFSQNQVDIPIQGVIIDNNGETVIGASIIIKGTSKGTVTDVDGKFTLNAPQKSILVLSYIGYIAQEIEVKDSKPLKIVLQENTKILDEVVVIGYGSVKKDDATGSVVAIKAEGMNKGLTTSPQELLSGKVAGVNISSEGGAPGAGARIRIRGGSSLNASNDPLVVIDGVPMNDGGVKGLANPLSMINPDDIETFTVLKDASATAIYGSRGSNGVVLITTKKGRSGAKPKMVYNGNMSVSTRKNKVDVLSADEYRGVVKDVFGESSDIYKSVGKDNTNWQDEIFRTALGTEHNLSVMGGMKNMPYRASVGYTNQEGILETSKFERISGSVNLSPSFFNEHLKVNVNLKGSHINNRFADVGAINSALTFDPTAPIKNGSKYGGYTTWEGNGSPIGPATKNPVALLEMRDRTSSINNFIGSAMVDYKMHFLPDLRAVLNVAYEYSKGKENDYEYEDSPMAYSAGGRKSIETEAKKNELIEFYLNYDKKLESLKSSINVMAGYSWQHLHRKLDYLDKSVTKDKVNRQGLDMTESYLVSFYGRFNYMLMDKYMLTFTLREDGSSRFHKDNRWGLFPSTALGWKVKEESFLKDVKALSDLKVRLGWGITGQQNISNDDYPAIQYYSYSEVGAYYQLGDEFVQLARPEPFNTFLKWEETTTTNIGLDYGFLNNRINGSIDYYRRETKDLINEVIIPAGTNFRNRMYQNMGRLGNEGVEFSVNAKVISTNDLTVDIGLNVAHNKSKITELSFGDDSDYMVETGQIAGGTGNKIQAHKVGYAPSSFFVYEQVYDSNGNPIEGVYKDQNGDNIINASDRRAYKKPEADVTMGFYAKVLYKNWDFGFTSRASIGNYVYNNIASNNGGMNEGSIYDTQKYFSNLLSSALDTRFQNMQLRSDYYVQNASFFRIDNITLGYSFNSAFNIKVPGRIYTTVQNPFVFTKYKGLDPEVSPYDRNALAVQPGVDKEVYPRPLMFIVGLSLNF